MREFIAGILLIVEGSGPQLIAEGLVGRRDVPPNYIDAKNVRLDYGQARMGGRKLIFKKVRKTSSFKAYFFLNCSNLWAKT